MSQKRQGAEWRQKLCESRGAVGAFLGSQGRAKVHAQHGKKVPMCWQVSI